MCSLTDGTIDSNAGTQPTTVGRLTRSKSIGSEAQSTLAAKLAAGARTTACAESVVRNVLQV